MSKISACMVVYNEEVVIERCLESIKNLVDEIIVVHDGKCSDKTIEIAKKYTKNIFVREHIGEAEPHRVFSYEHCVGDWIFQIDADEYLDIDDIPKIKELIKTGEANGYWFNWEFWDGSNPVVYKGLAKLILFKKEYSSFLGIPHESIMVRGSVKRTNFMLHHRPKFSNVSWNSFFRKTKKWNVIHSSYFFPEETIINSFQMEIDEWNDYTKKVRKHPIFYMFFESFKILVGQLKNGQFLSKWGVVIALQQFVRVFMTYYEVVKRVKAGINYKKSL